MGGTFIDLVTIESGPEGLNGARVKSDTTLPSFETDVHLDGAISDAGLARMAKDLTPPMSARIPIT